MGKDINLVFATWQFFLRIIDSYDYVYLQDANAFQRSGSSKSFIKKVAPASMSVCPGFLVVNPTTDSPAATAAFNPEGESFTIRSENVFHEDP